jgi:aminoglycoside phosphotransferase (APT) family kinase protein
VVPAGAAIHLLQELRRALVPGGQVHVGFESRHGASRLLALKPAGAGTAFSRRTVRRLAERAGFAGCRVFAPVPFRHKFHQVLDLDRSDRMNFCADPYRTRGRVVRAAVRGWELAGRPQRLERRAYALLPGMTAILSTTPENRSFAERMLAELAASGRIPADARTLSRYFVRPRGVVVLAAGNGDGETTFVRLPLDARAALTCRLHHDTIVALAADARIPAELRALFPVPLAAGTYAEQPYFAETARPGESGRVYYARSARRYDRAIASAAATVSALRRSTEVPVRIDDGEFGRLCGDWLADLRAIVPAAESALDAVEDRLRATLLGATLPLGWHHGDYDFANLLYGPGDAVTGILDFEAFDPRGLPLIDLLLLLARRLIRSDGMAFGDVFVRAILNGKLAPLEAELFAREVAIVGVDERTQRAIAVCSWLNHLKLRRDSWLVRSPSWLDANLHAVLDTVRSAL